jgi:two-component system response regulator MtrA
MDQERACIVVVEDEPELLQMLRDVLELSGFHVIGLARPELAQTAISASRPDLFLIDIMLPGMSGIELAAALRSGAYSRTPMIAMSASSFMYKLATESGLFEASIRKPFDVADLLREVNRRIRAESGSVARTNIYIQ